MENIEWKFLVLFNTKKSEFLSEIKDQLFSFQVGVLLSDEIADSQFYMIKIKATMTLESINQKTCDICLQCSQSFYTKPNVHTTTLTHFSHDEKQNLQKVQNRDPKKQGDFPKALKTMEKLLDYGDPPSPEKSPGLHQWM